MDLTNTGFVFQTPISWKYRGYPTSCQGIQPNNYKVVGKKIVSGNCGGFCGECYAENLKVDIEDC